MNIKKKDNKFYETIEKPISLEDIEGELRQIKDEKRNKGFEVYDERIRELEKKIKLMKEL